jgi:hypothetical protein
MSKRPTMSSKDCGNTKRKQLSLSIKQKIELLMKIQNPENPKSLSFQAFQIRDPVLYFIRNIQVLPDLCDNCVPKEKSQRVKSHKSKKKIPSSLAHLLCHPYNTLLPPPPCLIQLSSKQFTLK